MGTQKTDGKAQTVDIRPTSKWSPRKKGFAIGTVTTILVAAGMVAALRGCDNDCDIRCEEGYVLKWTPRKDVRFGKFLPLICQGKEDEKCRGDMVPVCEEVPKPAVRSPPPPPPKKELPPTPPPKKVAGKPKKQPKPEPKPEPEPQHICGDGNCTGQEDQTSCPEDCAPVEVEVPKPPESDCNPKRSIPKSEIERYYEPVVDAATEGVMNKKGLLAGKNVKVTVNVCRNGIRVSGVTGADEHTEMVRASVDELLKYVRLKTSITNPGYIVVTVKVPK